MSLTSLEGKVAIVTGASRPNGMGFASAKALAEQGASVVLTDLPAPREDLDVGAGMGSGQLLEDAVKNLEATGAKALGIEVDITDPAMIQACVAKTISEFGGVDILVNNAGVFVGAKPFMDLTRRDWDLSWAVHVTGPADFIRAVVPSMNERGGGSIINNASNWAMGGFPDASAYVASKCGTVGLTKALAVDLGSFNIRVNAICPGNITTDISAVEFQAIAEIQGVTPEQVEQEQGEGCALKRRGKPQEVGEVVAFLASPAAAFISGVLVPIDGAQARGV